MCTGRAHKNTKRKLKNYKHFSSNSLSFTFPAPISTFSAVILHVKSFSKLLNITDCVLSLPFCVNSKDRNL